MDDDTGPRSQECGLIYAFTDRFEGEYAMTDESRLPLQGVRVIDYSHFLAGPHLSRCLSAMGA